MNLRYPWAFFLCGVVWTGGAELRWENPAVQVTSKAGEKLVRAAYRFTNVGRNPVAVVSVLPSCGCVTTALDKPDYGPGESGTIRVTFDLSMDNASGLVERTVKVTTSDAPGSPTVLRLRVNVPEAAVVSPGSLRWSQGERPAPKEAVVSAPAGPPVALTQPYSSSGDFRVAIRPVDGGRSFRVAITPRTTAGPCFGEIHLEAKPAAGPPEDLVLYAEVN